MLEICKICGSSKTEFIGFKNNSRLIRCKQCGVIYVESPPSWDIIESRYNNDYHCYSEAVSLPKEIIYDYFLKEIKRIKGLKILDVGCGMGEFLELVVDNEGKPYGIEFSDYASDFVAKKGIKVCNQNAEGKFCYDSKLFDIVTMWDVIEHLYNPGKALSEINRVLKKDGFLILSTPNFSGLTRLLFGFNAYQISLPEHLFYFNLDSIKNILNKHGFRIIKAKSIHLFLTNFFSFKKNGILHNEVESKPKNFLLSKYLKLIIQNKIIKYFFVYSIKLIDLFLDFFKRGDLILIYARKVR